MAQGKKSKSTGYISRGQRPNVARATVLAMEKDRRKNPAIADVLRRKAYRDRILKTPKGAHEKTLSDRYAEEDRVDNQAYKLLDQSGVVGLQKSTAVQAVKTNYIENLHSKWSPILKKYNEENKKK